MLQCVAVCCSVLQCDVCEYIRGIHLCMHPVMIYHAVKSFCVRVGVLHIVMSNLVFSVRMCVRARRIHMCMQRDMISTPNPSNLHSHD